MRFIYIIYISVLFLGMSCKRDELQFFDNNNYVYADLNKDATGSFYTKSFTFTFVEEVVKDTEIDIPFKFAGRIADHDRFFAVEAVDTLTDMVEGDNFSWTDGARGIVEAGKQTGNLRVKIYRKADMTNKTYKLTLKIVENGDFLPGQKELIRLEVTDRLIKPDWWQWVHTSYLGNYSLTKLKLWLTFMNVLDGTDPWSYPPYYVLMPWGTWSIGEAAPKASVTSFRNWLINTQGNPYDPDLQMNVSQSLGANL